MRRNKQKIKMGILTTLVIILGLGVIGATAKLLDTQYGWVDKAREFFDRTSEEPVIEPQPKPVGNMVGERPEGMSATSYSEFDGKIKFQDSSDEELVHEVPFVGNSVRWYTQPSFDPETHEYHEQIMLGFNYTTILNRVEDEFYKHENEAVEDYKYVSVLKSTAYFEPGEFFHVLNIAKFKNQKIQSTDQALSFFYKTSTSDKWIYMHEAVNAEYSDSLEKGDLFQFAIALRTNNKATNAYVHLLIE